MKNKNLILKLISAMLFALSVGTTSVAANVVVRESGLSFNSFVEEIKEIDEDINTAVEAINKFEASKHLCDDAVGVFKTLCAQLEGCLNRKIDLLKENSGQFNSALKSAFEQKFDILKSVLNYVEECLGSSDEVNLEEQRIWQELKLTKDDAVRSGVVLESGLSFNSLVEEIKKIDKDINTAVKAINEFEASKRSSDDAVGVFKTLCAQLEGCLNRKIDLLKENSGQFKSEELNSALKSAFEQKFDILKSVLNYVKKCLGSSDEVNLEKQRIQRELKLTEIEIELNKLIKNTNVRDIAEIIDENKGVSHNLDDVIKDIESGEVVLENEKEVLKILQQEKKRDISISSMIRKVKLHLYVYSDSEDAVSLFPALLEVCVLTREVKHWLRVCNSITDFDDYKQILKFALSAINNEIGLLNDVIFKINSGDVKLKLDEKDRIINWLKERLLATRTIKQGLVTDFFDDYSKFNSSKLVDSYQRLYEKKLQLENSNVKVN